MAERSGVSRVLLVEDDQANLALMREALVSEGIEVVGEATDGAAGVELAEIMLPDVVLMDLRIPELDAFEATRRIGALKLPTEVVILTFYGELLTEPAEAVGAFAYVVKGCSSEFMRDVIVQAARRAQDRRRRAQRR